MLKPTKQTQRATRIVGCISGAALGLYGLTLLRVPALYGASSLRERLMRVGDPTPLPSPTPLTLPPLLQKVRQALESAPSVHIVGPYQRQTWEAGTRRKEEEADWIRGWDGEREWLLHKNSKVAWVAQRQRDLAMPGNTQSYPDNDPMPRASTYAGVPVWETTADSITRTIRSEYQAATAATLTFDPKTYLPLRESRRELDGKNPAQTLVYDYAPLPPTAFQPLFPAGTRVYDLDALRKIGKPRLEKSLGQITLAGRDCVIRDIQVNRWGDVFVIYSGRLPISQLRIQQPDGTLRIVTGDLQVSDSLGRTSAGPDALFALGKQMGPLTLFLEGSEEKRLSYFVLECRATAPDPRPRRVTLQFTLRPLHGQDRLETVSWTSPTLKPASDDIPDLLASQLLQDANADLLRSLDAWELQTQRGHRPPPATLTTLRDSAVRFPADWRRKNFLEKIQKLSGAGVASPTPK